MFSVYNVAAAVVAVAIAVKFSLLNACFTWFHFSFGSKNIDALNKLTTKREIQIMCTIEAIINK